uniref:Uncharacterized protein n=1 Tax=Picea glauca TaxID=3330 RepID=A0A101LYT2_PICGL|nr:hypothetical protein ABT39_MTgene4860 [Picea glauca]QHR88640.1 hypothetical protein Q903MT_gene2654 [Picea sitchensis]
MHPILHRPHMHFIMHRNNMATYSYLQVRPSLLQPLYRHLEESRILTLT